MGDFKLTTVEEMEAATNRLLELPARKSVLTHGRFV